MPFQITKLVSIISIGIFGFSIWHYLDYLIRYYKSEIFCFGYPTSQVFINIGLSFIAIYLSLKLFNKKIKPLKAILLLLLIGFLMWFVISRIINF
jgi:hypothetical protein